MALPHNPSHRNSSPNCKMRGLNEDRVTIPVKVPMKVGEDRRPIGWGICFPSETMLRRYLPSSRNTRVWKSRHGKWKWFLTMSPSKSFVEFLLQALATFNYAQLQIFITKGRMLSPKDTTMAPLNTVGWISWASFFQWTNWKREDTGLLLTRRRRRIVSGAQRPLWVTPSSSFSLVKYHRKLQQSK